jgi:hypothetical protein
MLGLGIVTIQRYEEELCGKWRGMIHKGVQLALSGRRLRLGPYSTTCRLVDRKKTNTEFNKLTKQVERA